MRCYLHLADAHQTLLDRHGVEVSDLDQVRALVHEVATEMIQQGEAEARDWDGWRIEVADASGAVLLTIRLDALLS